MIHFWLVSGFLTAQVFATVLGADREPELRLVNVVFRHGDRTPDTKATYPKDPYANYTYYPIGRGGLTNEGKRREYQLGKVLKSRYGDFLGPIYDPSVLVARSSDIDRTKMSLQLVLSALYPPEGVQEWNRELAWQPIPALYSPLTKDLLFNSKMCSQYTAEYARVTETTEVKEKIAKFDGLVKSLGQLTGQTTYNTSQLYSLYFTFDAQRSVGLPLPDWVCEFYPDGELRDATILEYEIRSYNDDLKRMYGDILDIIYELNSYTLIRNITPATVIHTTCQIFVASGTLLRDISDNAAGYVNGTLEEGRKLYLYSGHEINVASLQSTLGVYEPHVPAYSSAVIIEFWGLEDEYFVKVLHYTGIPSEVIEQQIPGCEKMCPFDKFLELLAPVMATDADLLCP